MASPKSATTQQSQLSEVASAASITRRHRPAAAEALRNLVQRCALTTAGAEEGAQGVQRMMAEPTPDDDATNSAESPQQMSPPPTRGAPRRAASRQGRPSSKQSRSGEDDVDQRSVTSSSSKKKDDEKRFDMVEHYKSSVSALVAPSLRRKGKIPLVKSGVPFEIPGYPKKVKKKKKRSSFSDGTLTPESAAIDVPGPNDLTPTPVPTTPEALESNGQEELDGVSLVSTNQAGGGDNDTDEGTRTESDRFAATYIAEGGTALAGHALLLEKRRQASMRYARTDSSKPVPIETRDMISIMRLASLETAHKSESFNVKIQTKNYKLGWIFDPPSQRPKKWLTLRNMPTDHLTNGGSPNDDVTLINSPRSVLTLLRNGQDPMAIQKANYAELHRTMSIAGNTTDIVQRRYDFMEELRENEMYSLQHEYDRLCARLPREQVMIFFELLDPNDVVNTPQIVEDPADKTKCRVEPPAANALDAALAGVSERMARERDQVRKTVALELQNNKNLEKKHEEQQVRNVRAVVKREAQEKKRAEERKQDAFVRQMMAEDKAERRRVALDATAEERQRNIAERLARAEVSEAIATAARQDRVNARTERMASKRESRVKRLAAAAEKNKHQETQRAAILAEREAHRVAQAEEQAAKVAVGRQEKEQKLQQNVLRRESIAAKAEDVVRKRAAKAASRQADVDKRLAHFQDDKRTRVELHRLRDLQRQIRREEIYNDAAEKEELRIADALKSREDRLKAFDSFAEHRRKTLAIRGELERELKTEKLDQLRRKEGVKQFTLLQLIDGQIVKRMRTDEAASVRHELVERARSERKALSQYRQETLQTSVDHLESKEREAFFEMFHASNPSVMEAQNKQRAVKEARRRKLMSQYGSMASQQLLMQPWDDDVPRASTPSVQNLYESQPLQPRPVTAEPALD